MANASRGRHAFDAMEGDAKGGRVDPDEHVKSISDPNDEPSAHTRRRFCCGLWADVEKEVWGGIMDCRSSWGKEEDADTTIK